LQIHSAREWRPQLKEILNDAMTRVDVSVAEHLKKVESLMVELIARSCKCLVASEDQMIAQIKEHLEFWLVITHLA
jgi:hypothetical protein